MKTLNQILSEMWLRIITPDAPEHEDTMIANAFEEDIDKEMFSFEVQEHSEEDWANDLSGFTCYCATVEEAVVAFNERLAEWTEGVTGEKAEEKE